jgi:hypothetical protein
VADLLECVIQIKALENSIERLGRFVAAAPADVRAQVEALVGRLAAAERVYARAGLGLEGEDGPLPPAPALDAFVAERRANLRILEACTADQLGGLAPWPGRPGTTVADLVAIMLANDTDMIGELQRLCASRPRLHAEGW